MPASTRCPCGQPITPARGEYLWPHRDPDPRTANVWVRPGDDLRDRRWMRLGETATYLQCGSMVDFYTDRTPPTPWQLIGRCFLGRWHAVSPAVPGDDAWTVGAIAAAEADAGAATQDRPVMSQPTGRPPRIPTEGS